MSREEQRLLEDRHGRFHDYLRISLTDACNLRCHYCMPTEDMQFLSRKQLMTPEEIDALASLFVAHGVRKIRLTGGEPLVRKDAGEIIRRLGRLPVSLAITTNGVLLHRFLPDLRSAGLRSVNISLDSLDPEVNRRITRRDGLDEVRRVIEQIAREDFRVKVNMVVMQGVNEFEVADFVAWGREMPLHIRFIEYMPFDGNGWSAAQVVTHAQILELVGERFAFEKIRDEPNDTARAYRVPGFAGTFAVIGTMSQPFCSTCNRLRLTADGKLRNCLFASQETDLLSPLRRGEDVEPLIRDTVLAKHARLGGQLPDDFHDTDPDSLSNRPMISIGG
jgi:cyclic pyranopterin phosphate synthase